MITSDEQLSQAVEQLGRMYHALAALKKEVLPVQVRQFALMAEGPLDEIRKLDEAIGEYTAVTLSPTQGRMESNHTCLSADTSGDCRAPVWRP